MRIPTLLSSTALIALLTAPVAADAAGPYFERVATLPVYATLPEGTDPKTETSAEIITATPDGMMLVFTDSPGKRLGFVDIADPAAPKPAGSLDMGGEPTSATVVAGTILAGVNTSESKANPSGHIAVVDLAGRTVAAKCDVKGQPDSVAASPDKRFLVVAVENERDEDLNDGALPQLPAGHVAIFDLDADGRPTNCDAARIVDVTGLAAVAPEDPEPEFVDVNAANIAAVTLQENNHIVLVDLASGKVTANFSAGAVDLEKIDTDEDKVIAGIGSKQGVAREPDAIAWLGDDRVVTANEGDYEGGSRGFTVFDTTGKVLWDSGNQLEHLGMSHGHYPVKRAKAKGVEPEGVEVATFGDQRLIFVNAERGNFVAVYADKGADSPPEFVQFLPTGIGPEGVVAIPGRDLLAVANEADSAEDGFRATINVYRRGAESPAYPTIVSVEDPATGAPIGWGALSGLVADPAAVGTLYGVSDSYYGTSRIYTIDASATPARITSLRRAEEGRPAGCLRPGGCRAQGRRRLLGGVGGQSREQEPPDHQEPAPGGGTGRHGRAGDRPAGRARRSGRPLRLRRCRDLGRRRRAEGDRGGPARVEGRPQGHGQARGLRPRRQELGLRPLPAGSTGGRGLGRPVGDHRPGRRPVRPDRAGQPAGRRGGPQERDRDLARGRHAQALRRDAADGDQDRCHGSAAGHAGDPGLDLGQAGRAGAAGQRRAGGRDRQ